MTDDNLQQQIKYYRARAGENDDWLYRRGSYDRGPELYDRWFAEVAHVQWALGQLGYKVVVCPIESFLVCARGIRDLCEVRKTTDRVGQIAMKGMSLDEVKKRLGVERFLKLRERL